MQSSQRLSQYVDMGFGLLRSSEVILAAPNPNWTRAFKIESEVLQNSLQISNLQLYHCGSTSVSGLSAKPIIDILGGVPSLEQIDIKKSEFEQLGYEFKGEYGIPGRRYCTLYSADKMTTFVHLHIFEKSSYELYKHLVFAHYLRSCAQALAEYQDLKLHLVNQLKISRSEYSSAKNTVIQKLQREAEELWPFQDGLPAALSGSVLTD